MRSELGHSNRTVTEKTLRPNKPEEIRERTEITAESMNTLLGMKSAIALCLEDGVEVEEAIKFKRDVCFFTHSKRAQFRQNAREVDRFDPLCM